MSTRYGHELAAALGVDGEVGQYLAFYAALREPLPTNEDESGSESAQESFSAPPVRVPIRVVEVVCCAACGAETAWPVKRCWRCAGKNFRGFGRARGQAEYGEEV